MAPQEGASKRAKVFCFFFSKKKYFLACLSVCPESRDGRQHGFPDRH
jgi:hypothetical protein